jgi:RimJ/RimL family protein N-acetyltransferase
MYLSLASDAQKQQRDRLTHAAWGQTLSVEQFAARERRLRAHPWTAAGMQTWLLTREPGGAGEVLASCETFHTPSFLRGADGRLEQGDSWSIASVYTEERLRGRGHATRLMDLLAAHLESASPAAHAVVLYSDVGAPLYQRSGYRETAAHDWVLPAQPGPVAPGVDALLTDADVPATLARMRRPEAPFFLWPTAAQVDWHLERERIYAQLHARARPPACGARVGEGSALWAMVSKTNQLVVLLLDARTPAQAHALLGAAARAAHAAGLSRVVLWEEPGTAALVQGLAGAERVVREDSLPMLRPLREGLPSVQSVPFPRVLWV